MNATEYRSNPALNFSTAKHLLRSPAHYQAALAAPREETPAMLMGSLVHAVTLEARPLQDMCCYKPEGLSLATKEGKAWKAAQTLPIISESDAVDIIGMMNAVKRHQAANLMLRNLPHREQPFIADMLGVPCKALVDAWGMADGRIVIADLKTTDDSSPEAFARRVANYHYDMQAAWYCDLMAIAHGAEIEPLFYWIAVEKTDPYAVRVYDASDWIVGGRRKAYDAIFKYQECAESDTWPGPSDEVEFLPRPAWVK